MQRMASLTLRRSRRAQRVCAGLWEGVSPTTSVQGNPPLYEEHSLWEALSVVSQKWSFPTAVCLCVCVLRVQHIYVKGPLLASARSGAVA